MQKSTRTSQERYTTRFSWATVKREKDTLTIRIRLKPLRLKKTHEYNTAGLRLPALVG